MLEIWGPLVFGRQSSLWINLEASEMFSGKKKVVFRLSKIPSLEEH